MFSKYEIDLPEDNWYARIQPPDSLIEACRAGVEGEIENAEMYDRLLDETKEYPDVQQLLMQLQKASAGKAERQAYDWLGIRLAPLTNSGP